MPAWFQVYDPVGNLAVSALCAALPAVLLLVLIAACNVRIHLAALITLAVSLLIALFMYRMPPAYAAASAIYGAATGLFPIGWIVLNIMFFYRLMVRRGLFEVLRQSLAHVAPDPRIQLILIAFAFGSFLEGMCGFGAPVAITAAILIQLRFTPLKASGLALVANTAPVAFGSIGIPLITLAQVTDLDVRALSATTGALLFGFSLLIPFLVVTMLAGWRGMLEVWIAPLVAGVSYAVPQFLISRYLGPWLAAPLSGLSCIVALVLLLSVWRPRRVLSLDEAGVLVPNLTADQAVTPSAEAITKAWLPWGVLTLLILLWGIPPVAAVLHAALPAQFGMPWLHQLIHRVPPIVPAQAAPIPAIYKLDFLDATGTCILLAGIIAGFLTRTSFRDWMRTYIETIWSIRYSLLTIAAMLALGNVIRYSGADGTLGLALAHTGRGYPFFGTLLGWIGAAITGSDTSSNVLFGSLQKITAQQIGISAILMGAANTCGGVMGKMVSSQSIVVASTATNWYGHEGKILRYVFLTSISLALLMGGLVYLAAYVPPFTAMVAK